MEPAVGSSEVDFDQSSSVERILVDGRHACGNIHRHESRAGIECAGIDGSHTFRDDDGRKALVVAEYALSDIGKPLGQNDLGKRAGIKGVVFQSRDILRERY